jgi:hypothetical protein
VLDPTDGSNSKAVADDSADPVNGREAIAAELRRFVADVLERAGSLQAVSLGLYEMGFEGKNGALSEAAIQAWRYGGSMPGGDVICALSVRWDVSIDRYATGQALSEIYAKQAEALVKQAEATKRRLAALAPTENPS